jgi:alpha-tubulin suppressor-like RCC1 family protein
VRSVRVRTIGTSGRLYCWGWNADDQFGGGASEARRFPVAVDGLTEVTAVALGSRHTCALSGQGVRCFGSNAFGQLASG